MTFGVELANLLRDSQPEPQSGVHRNRYPDEARALDFVLVKAFDRNVHRFGFIARATQQTQRHRNARRLMAQLVTRNQENRRSSELFRHQMICYALWIARRKEQVRSFGL